MSISDPATPIRNRIKIEEPIDLLELLAAVWRAKFFVLGCSIVFCTLSIVYSLRLPNLYKSYAIVEPVLEDESLKASSLLGSFSGLGLLAGKPESKAQSAIEVIKSRKFLIDLVEKHGLMAELFAAKKWDRETQELELDNSIYDKKNDTWVRPSSGVRPSKPTELEAYERLSGKLEIIENPGAGSFQIKIEHISPVVATKWVEHIVSEINLVIKNREIETTSKYISYLENKLENIKIASLRDVFLNLIEEQTKNKMLAEVRDDYVFSVIDPARIEEKRFSPNRKAIVMVWTLLGIGLSLFWVVLVFLLSVHRKRE